MVSSLLVKGVLRYIMVSRFTSGGYLEVYIMVSRSTCGAFLEASWYIMVDCQGLLVEVILRYILVSKFTRGGSLEVYPGVKVN